MKHSKLRHAFGNIGRRLRDDRGVAAMEGVLVFLVLAGVLFGVMLLGQWGTHLQYAQMGSRLLTFNAGDFSQAKFDRPGNQAETTFSRDSVVWGSYAAFDTLPVSWFNTLFVLHNDRRTGKVSGTQRGRLAPEHGSSLFEYSLASLGYYSGSSAPSNPWNGNPAQVETTFLGITYWVGYHAQTPEGLDYVPIPPHSNVALLETVYARVGIK
jgi:hypothetical protein